MASTSGYVVPQTLVFEEFNAVPSEITAPLRAHVSGPHAYLVRHAGAEKESGNLGAYDAGNDAAFAWPGRPAGGVVDPAYTRLFVDGARLEYFADLIAADDVVAPVAGKPNRVRIADATYGFRANGVGFPRLPALYDRDVKPGDRVKLRGVAGATSYALETYVQGLAADQVPALIAPATVDAGNGTTRAATSVVTQVAGVVNCNTLVCDLSAYVAYGDGVLDDTYTVTVTAASAGDDLRTATLRVASASGQDDALAVAPAEIDAFFVAGRRGLRLKFTCAGHAGASLSTDDLVVGQSWTVAVHDDYKAIAAASAGTYTGAVDATYVVEVTRGGLFAGALPQVSVTTDVGNDRSGPTAIAAVGVAYPVGAQGVTITFSASGATGLRRGDRFYVKATAAVDGRFGTLVLGHNLPAAIQAASDLDLRLSVEGDIAVPRDRIGFEPATNWDQSALQLTVRSGMLAYDPAFTSQGVPVALPVVAGTTYVEYRAWRQELAGDVGAINDPGLLDATIAGPLTPDNPLKWGVYHALLNSNGTNVKFTAVADPSDVAAWADVAALLVGRDDVYNLVPLTHDQAVLDLFAAHCAAQSSPESGRWRAMFASLPAVVQAPRVTPATSTDGAVVLATLADNVATAAADYTVLTVPAGNGQFLANGVRAGDVVRYLYSTSWGADTYQEFAVDSVISEDQLLLLAGPPAGVSTPRRVEVWHPFTKDEQAAAIGVRAAAYASRRVKATWPDQVSSGGTVMDGYYLCCALAGLRSGVVPHQGLTNVAIAGFDDVSRTTSYFNADQLNTMAAAGAWVVTQDRSGVVKTRHARTTDTTDINHSSEMVTANLDAISYLFLARMAPFIGVTNVTPTALARMHVELVSAIEYLKSNGFTDTLGSQLIDGTIVELRPHALLRDRVVGVIAVTLPYELDNLELHLVV